MFLSILVNTDRRSQFSSVLIYRWQLMWNCNLPQIICSYSEFIMTLREQHLHYHCVSHRSVTRWFGTTWELEPLNHFSQAVITWEGYYMWWMLMCSVKERKKATVSLPTRLLWSHTRDLRRIYGMCELLEVVNTISTHVTPENRSGKSFKAGLRSLTNRMSTN